MVVPVLAAGAWIFAAERVLAQPASDAAAVQAAESWKAAASLFREKVTAAQWEDAVRSARGPLGPVESRKRVSAQYTRTLPGAPDGEYVVIRYETIFQNKKSGIETVTPMKDKDGVWRVSGYFIQ